MIGLKKETQKRVSSNISQLSMKIDYNHYFCIILAAINWEELMQIAKDARKDSGKGSQGPEPHYRELLGALVVRILKSCTLREATDLIKNYIPARLMCNAIDINAWVPDFRTIHDFEKTLGENGLKKINEYVLKIAHGFGFLSTSILCGDTTAQEASIPYPTEVGLAHQFIKSLSSSVGTIGGHLGKLKNYMEEKLSQATQYLKNYRFFTPTKEGKKEILRELLKLAKSVEKKIRTSMKNASGQVKGALKGKKKKALNNMLNILETFKNLLPQMEYYLTTGKVAKDKIISYFQKMAKAIPRGKDGKEIEFGIKWCIGQFLGGYIYGFSFGNMYEGDYAVETVNEAIKIFGEVPESFGYDRGGWSEGHIRKIEELGVEKIGIAPKGKAEWLVSKKDQKKIFSERAQVEGKIGTLKHYGFNKPHAKTSEGMLRYGQLSILRFNLSKLGRDLQASMKLGCGKPQFIRA